MSARTIAVVAMAGAALAAAPAHAATATQRAAAYLESAQNADGGIGPAPGSGSTALTTVWSAFGLAAAGRAPDAVHRPGGASLADAVAVAAAAARQTGELERSALALRASGRPVAPDLVARLLERRRADGSFDGQVTWTAFGVLALRAAGRGPRDGAVRSATRFIARQQNRDGGFNFAGRGGRSGVDDTAAAVQGLVAGGRARRSATVRRAVRFLVGRQARDGGFPLQPGSASNAQSTSWAVQAFVAAGRDPRRVRRHGSRTPLGYLRSLQAADGSIRYSRTSVQTPVWVTAQALTALARRAFPVSP